MAAITRVVAGDALLLAGFLLFLELVSGAGTSLLGFAGSRLRGPLARWSAGLLAGIPLLGTAFLGLSLAGVLYPLTIAAAIVLICAPALIRRPAFLLPRALAEIPRSGWLPVFCLLAVLVPVFIPSLLPRIEHDAYQYHFAAPWAALANHRSVLTFVPYSFCVPMPVEMSYLVPMVLGDDRACGWLVLAAFLSAWGLFLALLPGDEKGWRGGLVPVAFLLGTAIPGLLTNGKTDLAATGMFAAGALLWTRRMWMSGAILLGFAPASKFVYGPLVAAFVILNPPPMRLLLPSLGLLAAPLVPWLAKSLLSRGNPVFPMLTTVFPTFNWDAENRRVFDKQTSELMDPATMSLSAIPWAWLRTMALQQPFALLAMCLIPMNLKWALVLASLVIGQWATLYLGHIHRYLMPAFLAALLLAPGLALPGRRRATRLATMGLTLLAVGWFWVRQVPALYTGVTLRNLVTDRQVLLVRDLTTYGETIRWLKEHGIRRSLAVGQFITYRAPGRVFINGSVGETPILWKAFHESPDLPSARKKLRQFGISTLWYNFVSAKVIRGYYSGSFEWDDRTTVAFSEFLRRYSLVVSRSGYCDHLNGGYYLYDLHASPGAPETGPLDYLPGAESLMAPAIRLGGEGRIQEALAEMVRLVHRWPEFRFLRNELGYMYAQRGEWKRAYDTLKPLIPSPMMDSTLRPAFGTAAMGIDRIDEAERILEASLRMHPSSAREIRLNLAAIASRRALAAAFGNRFAEAKALIEKARALLDFSPEGLPPASTLDWRSKTAGVRGLEADVAAAEGRFGDAHRLYKEAYRLGPDIPGAENWKAKIGEMRELEGRARQ